jgi:hypothetical protein
MTPPARDRALGKSLVVAAMPLLLLPHGLSGPAADGTGHEPTTESKTRRRPHLRRSWSVAHGLPLDDWRLRKKLTYGVHSQRVEGEIYKTSVYKYGLKMGPDAWKTYKMVKIG